MASFIKHYQELEKKYSNRFVFHEKELIISVLGQKHPQSNWQKISDALKEADSLDIPRKNYKVILAELREMREL